MSKNKSKKENKQNIVAHPNSSLKPKLLSLIKFQFIRFIMVGVVNTGFSYGTYALLLYLGLEYQVASLCALILGILFSFKTQGTLVFLNPSNRLFIRFFLCWMLIYLFNIFIIGKIIQFGLDAYQA